MMFVLQEGFLQMEEKKKDLSASNTSLAPVTFLTFAAKSNHF